MDTGAPARPTLAAVRLARAHREAGLRRLRPMGLVVLAIVLADAFHKTRGLGLHADTVGVAIAMAALALGGAAAFAMPTPVRRVMVVVPTALLLAGSFVLVWLQPGGSGSLGFFVTAVAVIRLVPERRDRLITVAAVAAASVVLVLALAGVRVHDHRPGVANLLSAVLPVIVCAFAIFRGRVDQYSYQMERLLIDLEHAQDAEVRAAALAERQRVAREMHDVLAHSLSGLALQLEGARLLAIDDPADPRLADTIERAHHLARSGLQEARRAIGMLRDEELPGPERLAALAADFECDSGVRCDVTITGEPHELGSQARLAVYRVAQEALTNIRKHAHADRVKVVLSYEPAGTRLTVEDLGHDRSLLVRLPGREGSADRAVDGAAHGLADRAAHGLANGSTDGAADGLADGAAHGLANGSADRAADGLADGAAHGLANGSADRAADGGGGRGYGLTGMRERAELLGGWLTASRTASGFLVELWVPT
jgi:signal transduction histidine kinase